MRRLIINADDFNLTPGVNRGILLAHDRGVISSTTVMINLLLEEKTIQEVQKRKKLGVGIHLNVTLGEPVDSKEKVRSLLNPEGKFRRPSDYAERGPRLNELIREYGAQIGLFEKRFGRKPDHLDTHHHLHNQPVFFEAVSAVAKKWKLPIRRSRIFQQSDFEKLSRGVRTTDYLFGNLETRFIWQKNSFLGILEHLSEGTSEIGCHPGFCDSKLRNISSLQDVRDKELSLFSSKEFRKTLSALGIELIRFSEV